MLEQIGQRSKRPTEMLIDGGTLKDAACGYTEDPDLGSVQGAAGVGCHYVYKNPDAKDPMNREVEDWVNVSQDSSVPKEGFTSRFWCLRCRRVAEP